MWIFEFQFDYQIPIYWFSFWIINYQVLQYWALDYQFSYQILNNWFNHYLGMQTCLGISNYGPLLRNYAHSWGFMHHYSNILHYSVIIYYHKEMPHYLAIIHYYYITLLEFHYVTGIHGMSEFMLHASKFILYLNIFVRLLFHPNSH